jgi:hypothetical protein
VVASLQHPTGCFIVSQRPVASDGKKDGKGKEKWLGTQYSCGFQAIGNDRVGVRDSQRVYFVELDGHGLGGMTRI